VKVVDELLFDPVSDGVKEANPTQSVVLPGGSLQLL